MNKKQIKLEALKTIKRLIYKELYAPTGLTSCYGEPNREKIRNFLEEYNDKIQQRIDRLTL